MNIEKLNLVGIWPAVGGALICVLWEIFDSPEDINKGLSDGLKGK